MKALNQVIRPAFRWFVQTRFPKPSSVLPILMYHRILCEPDALRPGVPTAQTLDIQLKTLTDFFHVVPLQEAHDRLLASTLPPRSIAITFDDGYRDNYEVAAPLLRKYKVPATVFVATGFLDGGLMFNDIAVEAVRRFPSGEYDFSAFGIERCVIGDLHSRLELVHSLTLALKYLDPSERFHLCELLIHHAGEPLPTDLMMTSDQVRQLRKMGVTIGGHTLTHPILCKVDAVNALREIRGNRDVLKDILGEAPTEFAYPNGKPNRDYAAEHVEMVKQAGYGIAVSTSVAVATPRAPRFEVPRFVLSESTPTSIIARMCRMTQFRSFDVAHQG